MPRSEPILRLAMGLPYHHVTMDQALDDCEQAIIDREPRYMATANVDFACQAYEDAELNDLIFHAYRVVCDGWPLVWQSEQLGNALPERVAGSDLLPLLVARCAEKEYTAYFFGSDDQTLVESKRILEKRHPGLRIVGYEAPAMGKIHEWDNQGACARITAANPDVLLIALGCPKQERWYRINRHRLQVPLAIGIGASLDFIAGKQTRAPRLVQKVGMEWFWRMLTDPKRLVKRYANNIKYFHYLGRRERRLAKATPRKSDAPALANTEFSTAGMTVLRPEDLSTAGPFPADGPIVADFSETPGFTYEQLSALVHYARSARIADVPLAIYGAPPAMAEILTLTRLDRQLKAFQDADALSEYIRNFRTPSLHGDTEPPTTENNTARIAPSFLLNWNTFNAVEAWANRQAAKELTIDLGKTPLVDCNAMVRCLELKRQLGENGRGLHFENVRTDTRDLMDRLGLAKELLNGNA